MQCSCDEISSNAVNDEISSNDSNICNGLVGMLQLKMSVTPEGIHIAQAYDIDGVPLEGGLMDPRLGPVDKSFRCLTCQGLMGECMGHFGHIRLFEPVYHVCFLSKVLKILRCICYFCYKLLVRPDATKFREILVKTAFPDRRRFQKVYELCKGKNVCDRLVEEDCGDFDGVCTRKGGVEADWFVIRCFSFDYVCRNDPRRLVVIASRSISSWVWKSLLSGLI